MQEKKKQTMRFTDAELELIKRIFAENDTLITQLRKKFLQFPLSAADKENIAKTFPMGSEAWAVLFKLFNPKLDPEAPLYQLTDMWLNVEIKDRDTEMSIPYIIARDKLVKYFDTLEAKFQDDDCYAFAITDLLSFDGKSDRLIHADILTRNAIVSHTEAHLNQSYLLAGLKTETIQQTTERLKKNSSK